MLGGGIWGWLLCDSNGCDGGGGWWYQFGDAGPGGWWQWFVADNVVGGDWQ